MTSEANNKPFERNEQIGSGTYSTVYRGRLGVRKAAIKTFRLSQCMMDVNKINNEIELLKGLRHRHIILFYDSASDDKEISLITEVAENGSLKRAIKKGLVAAWDVKVRIALEIADGLAYIHEQNILHRDIKSANVLLTRWMEVKLGDFGLATVKRVSETPSTSVALGTVPWRAPELLGDNPDYSTKSDVYALGMVMWEMAAMQTFPFEHLEDGPTIAAAVLRGEREQLPGDTPADYRDWVERCWRQNPSERPEAHEITLQDDTQSMNITISSAPTVFSASNTALSISSVGTELVTAIRRRSILPLPLENIQDDQQLKNFTLASRMASLGDLGAQVKLAEIYENGDYGVSRNEEMAYTWYLTAAKRGHVKAMVRVGDMLSTGRGVGQNETEAIGWYLKAAGGGEPDERDGVENTIPVGPPSPKSKSRLSTWLRKPTERRFATVDNISTLLSGGRRIFKPDKVEEISRSQRTANENSVTTQQDSLDVHSVSAWAERPHPKAMNHSMKATNQGNPEAQFTLGVKYAAGQGVDKNDVEAVKWLTKAADQGHPEAQFCLGVMYVNDRGVDQNNVEAVKWLTKAAEQGDLKAQFYLGVVYVNGRGVDKNDAEAAKWFAKAADQGHPEAQFCLGVMYKNGRGVDQNDVEAVKWLTKAAEQGYLKAQPYLGLMYKNGRGVDQNDVDAVKWFTKAAEQGDPQAQFYLGSMYADGRGVCQSDFEAVKWLTKAADQGHQEAQADLGSMYADGRGVDKSDVEAAKWFIKAAKQGI